MPTLPQRLRRLVPPAVRDDVRLRAIALGLGLIPPRAMHSDADLEVLRRGAEGARRVVEIGVYEGGSAVALMALLGPAAELHLVDPFGHHRNALPRGWGASERATRRVVARAARRLGARAPRVVWHVARSHEVAMGWGDRGPVDLVFIDGDHSERGCELDWRAWSPLVARGGRVAFHDARAGAPGGRGLPGPTAVVRRLFPDPAWSVLAEADRTVLVRRVAASQPPIKDPSLARLGTASGATAQVGSLSSERHR
jgi:predicted O-methyltransferase YrrM